LKRHHFMRNLHPIPSSIFAVIPSPQYSPLPAQPISTWDNSFRKADFSPLRSVYMDLKTCTWACLGCQQSKFEWHTKTRIGTFLSPSANHVHMDVIGPFPQSNDCSYLISCADRFI
uniref:Zf-RVT domain-containing protein n=1 Tax=Schistocephalus solidus TaxID=70667 RepID=A0A183T9T4_SCHSO